MTTPAAYATDSGIPNPTMPLQERAVLVSLRTSAWNGVRKDKTISAQVAAEHGATSNAGVYSKRLVVDSTLNAIHALIERLRKDISDVSAAWGHGVRILPVALLPKVQRLKATADDELRALKMQLAEAWPTVVESQRLRLGQMFRPSDYPEDIGRLFSIGLSVMSVPVAGDFRVSLSNESMALLRQTVEEDTVRALRSTQADLLARMLDPITRLAERLEALDSTEPGRFYASNVTNIIDLFPILRELNLEQSPEIDSLLERFVQLTRFQPDELKDNPASRSTIRDEARELSREVERTVQHMEGLF